jgi:drug/metabolite transporter (DMT)-like permease
VHRSSHKEMIFDSANRKRTAIAAGTALIAFASNSIICRIALRDASIDAGSFSAVRLLSGAVTLWLVLILSGYRKQPEYNGSWTSAAMLFLYAFAFSFAYVELSAGIGALILFGGVQTTMISAGIVKGERPHPFQWVGLLAALGGLLYLVMPGLTVSPGPSPFLMIIAGIAWGIYSLRGRSNRHAVAVTTDNFIRTIPFVFISFIFFLPHIHLTLEGFLWAVLSGAVTSGIGYIIWYIALPGLTATRAAIIQLAVPVLAAIGGILLLSEPVTLRLIVAAFLTLGGIALAILVRQNR